MIDVYVLTVVRYDHGIFLRDIMRFKLTQNVCFVVLLFGFLVVLFHNIPHKTLGTGDGEEIVGKESKSEDCVTVM